MVIYEVHVKALPCNIPTFRRSFVALTRMAMSRPLSTCNVLGVTTVELMPVHAFLDDRHLVERGCAITGI